jgi:hypothetical protein
MENGYLKVESAISHNQAKALAATLLIAEANGQLEVDNLQVEGAMVVHGHASCEALMLQLLPLMQKHTDLELLPTYSFARIYRKGDELKRHKDRPSCDVSATVTLGFIADSLWPIHADNSGPIVLDVGDMLIYRGCEVEHWREPFKGGVWVQVFLHYVDANGPHKEWAFDKRGVGELYETIYATMLA